MTEASHYEKAVGATIGHADVDKATVKGRQNIIRRLINLGANLWSSESVE